MKLIYKNTNGDQIEIGQLPPFLLIEKTGFGGVENLISKEQLYGVDGSSLINQQLSDRDIKIKGEYLAEDTRDLQEKRVGLSSAFNPKFAGVLVYQQDSGQAYEIDVLVTQPPTFDTPSDNLTQAFEIDLLSLSSYWTDKNRADKLIPLSTLENRLVFPLQIVK